jgi:hypothetical protein
MKFPHLSAVLSCLLFGLSLAVADDPKPSPSAHITNQTRVEIIRAFTSELVYLRTTFPMGQRGLVLKNGTISPNAEQLQPIIALYGPAAKPGDQAILSAVLFKGDRIHFEINGGPIKKKKWYQHIVIAGAGGDVPIAPGDSTDNPHGSFVDVEFDHYIPDLTPQQLKDLLRPVFDFNSKSVLEAYLETVPPKVKEAIQHHRVLVGMNREMVIYAKGRAPRKTREKDSDTDEAYEEWIYGEPPQDVDFVRFVEDTVVRVETMKVTGEKIIRTEKEVDLPSQPKVAKEDESGGRPPGAPSLRRPGEAADPSMPPTSAPAGPVAPMPPPAPPPNSPVPQ